MLAKIDAIVAEFGATNADIASVQVWLANMADFQGKNAVWDAWVDTSAAPARATGSVALARAGMRVETIATVGLPTGDSPGTGPGQGC